MQPRKDISQPLSADDRTPAEAGSVQQFREFADSVPGMLWVTEADGRCTFLSRGWYEFTGQAEAEALGLGWTNAVHPEDREWAGRLFLESNDRREPFQCEYRLRRADGAYRWALDVGRPRFSPGGEYLGYVGSVIEVHERKQAEQDSNSNRRRLELALDAGRMGTWELDLAAGALTCSAECKRNYGRSPADSFTYEELAASVHDDDRERWSRTVEDCVARSADLDVEYRTRWPDGSTHWVLVRAACTTDAAGRTVALSGVSLDVTDRKQGEEETRRLDEQRKLSLDAAQLGSWNMNPVTQGLETDERFRAIFGVQGDSVSFEDAVDIIHPGDRDRVRDAVVASTRPDDPLPYSLEYRVVHPDGSVRWVFAKGRSNFTEETGERRLTSFDGTIVDVTERKRTEVVLEEQKHILELIATGAPLGGVLDAVCLMVEAHAGNTLFASVLVLDRDGKHMRRGGAPSLPEAYNRIVDGIATGPNVGSCGSAAHLREPVFVADIATDPLWADYVEVALSFDLRACWSIPIFSAAGEVLGTFAMYHPTPRHPNPEDLQLVDIVTRTAAIAIERERTEQDRRQTARAAVIRNERLQKLADIATRVNSARDVNSVLGVVTEEARNLVGSHQAATTMVLNPNHPQPLNVVSNSEKYPYGTVSPRMDGLAFYEAVREAGEPVRMTRSELDADPRWDELAKAASIDPTANGWLAVPLIGRDGRSMGLIQLSDKAEGEFDEDDEAILAQLSHLASIAVMNARLNEELRSNDERKDEFLAMLAHELRNPLAAIGNAVNLGKRTDQKKHIEWAMDVITRQMQHLSRLIDDLMDVSRITRGKIQLRRDTFDLTPILESAASTVGTLVEERKHKLELDVEPGGLWVDVDPTRIEQVVVNLLNNAAKYSENEGHIRLSARVLKGQVVVSIKDKGVGIAPEKLPEMFELFAQGDRSLARSEGGLGIGLTVVKKLVEMHGGTIAAASEGLGWGSEFVVRLPLVAAPADAETDASPTLAAVRRAKILVVDDNVDTARGMAKLLQVLGHQVTVAHNGPEAIEAARAGGPDFILLDIGLPGMSGYEVASQLRREKCCKDATIIAVSGYGQDEDRRRSKESGFDFHLTKPLDTDALLSLISASPG